MKNWIISNIKNMEEVITNKIILDIGPGLCRIVVVLSIFIFIYKILYLMFKN